MIPPRPKQKEITPNGIRFYDYLKKKGLPFTTHADCSVCGCGVPVCHGYVSHTITKVQIAQALKKYGWVTAPKYICDRCIKRGWRK